MHHDSTAVFPSNDPSLQPSRYGWAIVGMLWFVGLLNYLDRLMITTMRDPIVADIHINDAQFGMLTSVFLWVYALASPLGGYLADRFSRRGVIIASMIAWSAATWVTGFTRSYHELLLARALMGLSEACYIPAALALIADYHRGPTRSLANGLHMVGIYTGAVLGGLGGYLALGHGWRFGFKFVGLIGVLYGIGLLFALRDAPRANAVAQSDEDAAAPATASESFTQTIAQIVVHPAFLILLGANILASITNWAIYGWLPTFLKQNFGLGLGAAGLSATAYIQVASFVGVIVAGALADRWSRTNRRARAIVPGIAYMLAGPCLFLAASTSFLPVAILGLIVFGLGRGAYDANLMPVLRELVDERRSATAYGLMNFLGSAAGGVMVYVGGALLDAHVSLARVFQGAGIGLCVVSVLLLIVRFPRRLPPVKESSLPLFEAAATVE